MHINLKQTMAENSWSCFLCLEAVPVKVSENNNGNKFFCLKQIFRHLKLNPFTEEEYKTFWKSQLDFTVPLCDNCGFVADKLSKLYEELNLIQIKVAHYLDNLSQLIRVEEELETDVENAIRRKTKEQCIKLLKRYNPKVIVEKADEQVDHNDSIRPSTPDSSDEDPSWHNDENFKASSCSDTDEEDLKPKVATASTTQQTRKPKNTPKPKRFKTGKVPKIPKSTKDANDVYKPQPTTQTTYCSSISSGKSLNNRVSFTDLPYFSAITQRAKRIKPLVHVCQYCLKGFEKKVGLRVHLTKNCAKPGNQLNVIVNEVTENLNCQVCSKVFANENLLNKHQLLYHRPRSSGEVTITCSFCKTIFMDNRAKDRHIANVHPYHFFLKYKPDNVSLEDFKNLCCNELKSLKKSFARVKLPNREELGYSCPYCNFKMWKPQNLSFHLIQKHLKQVGKCIEACYKGKKVENTKETKKEAKCTKSKKKKVRKVTKKTTVKEQDTSPTYKCSLCEKSFADKKKLHKHRQEDHCSFLFYVLKPKSFTNVLFEKYCSDLLTREVKLCTVKESSAIKIFKCIYCVSSFLNEKLIKDHILRAHRTTFVNKLKDTLRKCRNAGDAAHRIDVKACATNMKALADRFKKKPKKKLGDIQEAQDMLQKCGNRRTDQAQRRDFETCTTNMKALVDIFTKKEQEDTGNYNEHNVQVVEECFGDMEMTEADIANSHNLHCVTKMEVMDEEEESQIDVEHGLLLQNVEVKIETDPDLFMDNECD